MTWIPTSRAEAVEVLRASLNRAVSDHLVSDVPVGLFLSGGIDSGALAVLIRQSEQKLKAITLGFEQAGFDETEYAASLAKTLGFEHLVVRLSQSDLLEQFPRMLDSMDQPSIDGFNTFLVSKAVKDAGLKVVLSGLGGDELFGGYKNFTQVPTAARLRAFTPGLRPLGTLLASGLRRDSKRALQKLVELLRRKAHVADIYFLRREVFLNDERRRLLPITEGSDPQSGLCSELVGQLREEVSGLDAQNQVSLLELNAYMRYVLLRDSDNFSMAHGVELRVPFLDTDLVELVRTFPGAWKRPSAYPKPLLVDAIAQLPESIYKRRKQGFALPWAHWMRGELRELFLSYVHDETLWKDLGIDPREPVEVFSQVGEHSDSARTSMALALLCVAHYAKAHRLSR